jgi:hypothetical protein
VCCIRFWNLKNSSLNCIFSKHGWCTCTHTHKTWHYICKMAQRFSLKIFKRKMSQKQSWSIFWRSFKPCQFFRILNHRFSSHWIHKNPYGNRQVAKIEWGTFFINIVTPTDTYLKAIVDAHLQQRKKCPILFLQLVY